MSTKIPRLRFPQFAEHSEWEEKKIGEILKIGSGKDYKHLKQGNIPVFGSGGLMTFVDAYLYDGETVCIGRKGTIDKPTYYRGKIWTVDTLFYTHSFNSYPKFVFALFQKINWKEHNEASGVPSLSKSTIEKIKIILPSLAEQTQIADFLTAVDKRISLLKQKYELLQSYKKGIMQQIFSQELRFKDDAGQDFPEWEEKTLGEVFYSVKGKGLSKDKLSIVGKNKCILYGELYTKYNQVISNVQSRTDFTEGLKSEVGDLLMPTSTTTSNLDVAIATALNEANVLLGGDISVLRNKGNASNVFFAYYLSFFKKLEMANYAQGTTIVHLYFSHLQEMRISLPCLSEQKKIAEFLTAIDDKIEKTKQQLAQSEEWKRGLLQCMLV